jgi:alanyl-tRNA synthetase
VDRGSKYGPEGGPDVDEERFMEIWNLVFIQDQVDADLNIIAPLPGKNVDTGSSLERVATVLQGVDNVFETDLFRPTLEVAERLSGRKHGQDPHDDVSLKIIAEHGPGGDLPDRRRGPTVEHRPRLRPAPDAATRRPRTRADWASSAGSSTT